MILNGVFKGSKRKAYNFLNDKGEEVKGITNVAFIEQVDEFLAVDERLVKVKLPDTDYVCSSKDGQTVSWLVSSKFGKISLVSEKLAK